MRVPELHSSSPVLLAYAGQALTRNHNTEPLVFLALCWQMQRWTPV